MRYRLLETIRRYAEEKRQTEEDETRLREAHRRHFCRLAEDAAPHLTGPDQLRWLSRLDAEHDNLRVALTSSFVNPEERLMLAATLGQFWRIRGYIAEGRAWLETALADIPQGDPGLRSKAYNRLGVLTNLQGDSNTAHTCFQQSLTFARQADDPSLVPAALSNLGMVASERNDIETAQDCYRRCLALYEDLGDTRRIALTTGNLGVLALNAENYVEAEQLLTRTLTLQEGISDQNALAITLYNLAQTAMQAGDLDASLNFHHRSLSLRHALGDPPGVARSLFGMTLQAEKARNFVRAARLAGAVETMYQDLGALISPVNRAEFSECCETLSRALGKPHFERYQTEGGALSLDEAINYALSPDDFLPADKENP